MVTFPILYMTQYAKVFVSIPFIYISTFSLITLVTKMNAPG